MRKHIRTLVALGAIMLFGGVFQTAQAGSVMVFGGSGRLGAEVVRDLINAGEKVVVFVRPTSDRGRLEGLDVEFAVGDLLDEESVRSAFETHDIDAVINAVALRPGETNPYVVGERNIDAATQGRNLSHLMLFSATGAGDSKSTIPPSFYEEFRLTYEYRTESEEIIKSSGTPYTLFRIGTVHDKPETGTATLVDGPVLGPTTRADAAALAVKCLRQPRCINKTFHITDESLPLIPEE